MSLLLHRSKLFRAFHAAAPAGPTPTSHLKLDEASGTDAADEQQGDVGTYVGSPDLGAPALIADSGSSVGGKAGPYVSRPHIAAFEVPEYGVFFRFALAALPAVGAGVALCSKTEIGGDNHNELSIEAYNNAGSMKLRAYTTSAAGVFQWIGAGGSGGNGSLLLGKTYVVGLVQRSTGASLYLDTVEYGPNAVLDGLEANGGDWTLLAYRRRTDGAALILATALIDDWRFYDFAPSQEDIEAISATPVHVAYLKAVTKSIAEGSGSINVSANAYPTSGYTAEVVADGAITDLTGDGELFDYTTDSVEEDTADSATIRINFDGAVSPNADLDLTVLDGGGAGTGLVSAYDFEETSGLVFADSVGGNDATLVVPPWTFATHTHDRPGIAVGSDNSLEVSNGGPTIPMIAAYQNANASLVMYVNPLGTLRGMQHYDENHERSGLEMLAFCDDGSTPGSFAVYRRRFGQNGLVGIGNDRVGNVTAAGEWRLGGYVRDSGGTKQYFGGALTGVSGTSVPVDTSKKVGISQGSAGAKLFLDDAQVATLATTAGWTSLTDDIQLGCTDDVGTLNDGDGHPNTRSPLWARIDRVEIHDVQLDLAAVQAMPAAKQSLRYKLPTDGPLINVNSHGGDIQDTIDAAAAVNGYAYQDESTNTSFYTLGNSETIQMKAGCRGLVGIRAKRPSGQNNATRRMFRISASADGGALPANHGDPWAATGGWKIIGGRYDGNARGQDWAPEGASGNKQISNTPDGTTYSGFNLQFAHIFQLGGKNSGSKITVGFDAVELDDNTGDGISMSVGAAMTRTRSLRMSAIFRGAFIYNDVTNQTQIIYACEFLSTNRLGGFPNGTGLCDLEPFEPAGSQYSRFTIADAWYEGDIDDRNYELESTTIHSWSKYYNCHSTAPGVSLQPTRTGTGRRPTQEVLYQRCTFCYYKTGIDPDGSIEGSFPLMTFRGFDQGVNGTGALFEGCITIADGRSFALHHDGLIDPTNDLNPSCELDYTIGGGNGKILTMRYCEWRTRRLSHISAGNRYMIDFPTLTTSRTVEFDNVTIDSAFALGNIDMGGCTFRHRNVVHEGNPGASISQICPGAGVYTAF